MHLDDRADLVHARGAVGQIAGGPPFGLLATWASTRVAMVAAALVLLPALALYQRSARPSLLPPEEGSGALPEAW